MHPLRYMMSVVQTGPISLTHQEEEILSLFIRNGITSTYMIWKFLNRRIAYKNVHKKVVKLRNFELIRIVKKRKIHGAIYYQLTSLGIFYSIQSQFYPKFSKLIDNYGNDEILNIFLYPYLEKHTIRSLNSGIITGIILGYLIECSKAIYSEVYRIMSDYRQDITTAFYWSRIPSNDGFINKYFIQYLREHFEINWLTDNASLEKSPDGKELKITSHNKKYLVIKLNANKSKATLMDDKDVIFEFLAAGDDIMEYNYLTDDKLLRQYGASISNSVLMHVQKLSFRLLSLNEYNGIQAIYPYEEFIMKEGIETLKQDIDLIKKDKKFVALCKYFYKQFEKYKIF